MKLERFSQRSKNLFVVLLVMAPSYLEVGASGNPGAVHLRHAGPSRMGCPPFCPVLKLRILVLLSLHELSLERTA